MADPVPPRTFSDADTRGRHKGCRPSARHPSGGSRGILLTILPAILLGTALLRLGFWALGPADDFERAMEPDSRRYALLADNLLQHGTFAKAEEDGLVHRGLAQLQTEHGTLPSADAHGLRPEGFRTPGYPVFLAAVRGLGLPLTWVLPLQCVLSVLGVWLAYGIGLRLLGSRPAALFTAAIVAAHPAGWIAPNSVLAETLFTTLFLTGVYALVHRERHVLHAAAAGLSFGLAALVRPVGVLLALAAAMWLVAANITRPGDRLRGSLCAAVVLLAGLIPVSAWIARNQRVGIGATLSTVPTVNGLYYTAAHIRIAKRGGDIYHDWPAEVAALHHELGDRLEAAQGVHGHGHGVANAPAPANTTRALSALPDPLDMARQMTREQIAAEPMTYARLVGRSAVKFFTDHSLGTFYERLGWTYTPSGLRDKVLRGELTSADAPDLARLAAAAGWMGFNAMLALATAVGLVRLLCVGRWRAALLLGGMVAYFVLATQTNGLERFRWPVIGLQAVIAAAVLYARPIRWQAHGNADTDANADRHTRTGRPGKLPLPDAASAASADQRPRSFQHAA